MPPKYKQLTREDKVKILTLDNEGYSCRVIADRVGCSHSTIVRFLKKKENADPLARKKGTGPKKKTSALEDRIIGRISLLDRSKDAVTVRKEAEEHYNINVSAETIGRRLRDIGLFGRRPAKKPLLNRKMKKSRLEWAKKYENWTEIDWRKVIFSDESKFNLFYSDGMKYVRRRSGERYREDCTVRTVKHSQSQMVWGCFSYYFLGHLRLINGTMNAQYYQTVIRENVVEAIEQQFSHTTEAVFQDDSAPCHRAGMVKNLLADLGIQKLDWPGNSPDMNPIENLWYIMKRKVAERKPTNKKNLITVIENVWNEDISTDLLQTLVDSMPSRIKAVIAARGGPTNY